MKCLTEDCDNEVKSEGDYCDERLQDKADIIREQEEDDSGARLHIVKIQ